MSHTAIIKERALEALRKGHTKKEIIKMFGISGNMLSAWEAEEKEAGSTRNAPGRMQADHRTHSWLNVPPPNGKA